MARDGLSRARALKPDPFFSAEVTSLIDAGGFDTDLRRLTDVDLIVEAVIEVTPRGLVLKEIQSGTTLDAVRQATGADLIVETTPGTF